MRRSKGGKREVAVRHPKLTISRGEMEEVGGKHGKAKFPGGNSAASVINVCFFPLEMFQGDGERWRQLGGKNLSFQPILFYNYYTVHCSPGRVSQGEGQREVSL